MTIRITRMFLLHLVASATLLVGATMSGAQPVTPPPVKPEETPAPPMSVVHAEADRRLLSAFDVDSGVSSLNYRIWFSDERIALAAAELQLLADKRVQVRNLNLAFFQNRAGNDLAVKTLRAPAGILKLDRPLAALADLGKCRILAVEAVEGESKEGSDKSVTPPPSVTPLLPSKATPVKEEVEVPKKVVEASGSTKLAIDPRVAAEVRFKFKIDPKAPLSDFVPAAPAPRNLPHWTNEDLARVPELAFGESLSKALTKDQALESTAHILAKINHVNQKKSDGFMLALLDRRADLRGLPVRMGDECRTREEQAKIFAFIADALRQSLAQTKSGEKIPTEAVEQFFGKLTEFNLIGTVPLGKGAFSRSNIEHIQRAIVASLVQILMPESENLRAGLAKFLATVPHVDATRALTKLALFSAEEEVRAAAIDGLKTRRERDYTDILLQGFQYPLPAVSKRAAEALVKLERKDALPNLVEVLAQPDPRLPVTKLQDGKQISVVRELVKVNHHRNCVLCHAPGNTETTPEGVLTVAVPLPNEPLPKPSQGGYQSTPPASPDIVVRIDMTYLRQDFSLMLPVSDAHPWPEMQRFDFLVRTRELTNAEAAEYEPCCEVEEPGRLSPYHRAALFALRELTGRDTEPTATAWRKLLKLPAR
jgi:hypothetical protein